jgi:hypothetical protein
VIKRQFGHLKVRYRVLKKNTAQLFTLFFAVQPLDRTKEITGCVGLSALNAPRRDLRMCKTRRTALTYVLAVGKMVIERHGPNHIKLWKTLL